MNRINIIISGTGGQGIIFLTKILGLAALKEGKDVLTSEIHGMSQRGGHVCSTVSIGKKVYSPLFSDGDVDFLLGLEPLESIRLLNRLSERTTLVINTEPITFSSISEQKDYPGIDNMISFIKSLTKNIILINAMSFLSDKPSKIITQNIIMLGVLSSTKGFPLQKNSVEDSICELTKPELHVTNLSSFEIGSKYAQNFILKDKGL